MIYVREIQCDDRVTSTRVFAAFEPWPEGRGTFPLGYLTVDAREDLIAAVYVDPGYRRRGVATLLLSEARRLTGLALATDDGTRTVEGSRWCRANGIRIDGRYQRFSAQRMRAIAGRMMVAIYHAPTVEEWEAA